VTDPNQDSDHELRTGSCICGSVRFETRGHLRDVIFCHCQQCRKQSGHYYAATRVEDARLYVTGEEHISWYAASPAAKRGFCRVCGSALFWKREAGEVISIMAGLFDSPTGLKGGYHIFTAEKGDYYTVTDGLPCFSFSDD
jgi:hypothetical protein